MARISGKEKIGRYNLNMLWNNGISFLYTKIFWKGARLVRYPIRVFGRNSIQYGDGLTIGNFSKIDVASDGNDKKLIIGKNCIFGDMLHIAANNHVVIGDNLLTASRVFITDTNHGSYQGNMQCSPDVAPNERELDYKETTIGNNVWIGENVCVLAGARIGNGCIIGANAVVKGNIPDRTIAVGAPAKIVKHWDNEKYKWIKC